MWYEIHWCSWMGKYMLYVGTPTGYRFGAVYGSKTTARISAWIHGYKFYDKK